MSVRWPPHPNSISLVYFSLQLIDCLPTHRFLIVCFIKFIYYISFSILQSPAVKFTLNTWPTLHVSVSVLYLLCPATTDERQVGCLPAEPQAGEDAWYPLRRDDHVCQLSRKGGDHHTTARRCHRRARHR